MTSSKFNGVGVERFLGAGVVNNLDKKMLEERYGTPGESVVM